MTATDELRRMLDDRGVEWEDHSGNIEQRTVYRTPNGWCYVSTANDKWLSYVEYHDMTPEQAVDATLGRGTCEVAESADGYGWYCECGNFFPPSVPPRNYCPNCGREVVNDQ